MNDLRTTCPREWCRRPESWPGTSPRPNARFVTSRTLPGPRPRVRASPGVRISGWQGRSEGAAGQNQFRGHLHSVRIQALSRNR